MTMRHAHPRPRLGPYHLFSSLPPFLPFPSARRTHIRPMEHHTAPTTHPAPDGLLFAPRFVAPAKGLGMVWPVDQAHGGGLPAHPAYWTVPSAVALAALLHLQGLPLSAALSPLCAAMGWAAYVAGKALWTLARVRRIGPDPRASAWPWKEADAEARRILAEGFVGDEAAFLAQARRVTLTWSGSEEGTSVLTVVVETERQRCIYAPRDARRVAWAPRGAWWAQAAHRLQHLQLVETRLDLADVSRHQRLAWMAALAAPQTGPETQHGADGHGPSGSGALGAGPSGSLPTVASRAATLWASLRARCFPTRRPLHAASALPDTDDDLPPLLLLDRAEL